MRRLVLILLSLFLVVIICAGNLPEVTLFCRAGPEAYGHRLQVEYWNKHLAQKYGFKVRIIEATRADYYTYVNNTLMAGAKTPDILESFSGFTALYGKSGLALCRGRTKGSDPFFCADLPRDRDPLQKKGSDPGVRVTTPGTQRSQEWCELGFQYEGQEEASARWVRCPRPTRKRKVSTRMRKSTIQHIRRM